MNFSGELLQTNATAFAKRWADTRREKADAQHFVSEFLAVFIAGDTVKLGEREKPVKIIGFPKDASEPAIVAALMERWQAISTNQP